MMVLAQKVGSVLIVKGTYLNGQEPRQQQKYCGNRGEGHKQRYTPEW